MSHIYSRSLSRVRQLDILQMTAHTGFSNNRYSPARPIHHNAVMLVETLCGQRQQKHRLRKQTRSMSLRSIV
jgi:hypothetical protein